MRRKELYFRNEIADEILPGAEDRPELFWHDGLHRLFVRPDLRWLIPIPNMRGVVPQATFGYFNAPAAFAFEERAAAGG